MKVIFEYDPISGTITDANGMCSVMHGMVSFGGESEKEVSSIKSIKELVASGVSVDDILKLKREGVI